MNPSWISQILQRFRGQEPAPAASVPAQMAQGGSAPLQVNPQMEQMAAPDSPAIHPMLQMLLNHSGLLSMLRNRRNQSLGDPTQQI